MYKSHPPPVTAGLNGKRTVRALPNLLAAERASPKQPCVVRRLGRGRVAAQRLAMPHRRPKPNGQERELRCGGGPRGVLGFARPRPQASNDKSADGALPNLLAAGRASQLLAERGRRCAGRMLGRVLCSPTWTLRDAFRPSIRCGSSNPLSTTCLCRSMPRSTGFMMTPGASRLRRNACSGLLSCRRSVHAGRLPRSSLLYRPLSHVARHRFSGGASSTLRPSSYSGLNYFAVGGASNLRALTGP